MMVDTHAHVVPDSFPSGKGRPSESTWLSMEPADEGRANLLVGGKVFRTLADSCWKGARRVAEMDAEHIDIQVISPTPDLLSYWFTPQDGLDMARHVNEFTAGLAASAPTRIIGLGMVPLQDPDLAAKELAAIKPMGLRGIEVGSNVGGKSLGDESFHDFWAEVERQDLPVLVHALRPTMLDRLPGGDLLLAPVGFPVDTGLTIASLIVSGVLEKYPNLRLSFTHGGGTFPSFLARLNHAWGGAWNEGAPVNPVDAPLRKLLPKAPVEYARKLYYDTLVFDERVLRFLADMLGVSQLVVGTDYPLIPWEKPFVNTLKTMFTAAEQEAIFSTNAFRFLGMEPPKA